MRFKSSLRIPLPAFSPNTPASALICGPNVQIVMGAVVCSICSFIAAAGGLNSMVDLSFIFIYSFLHSFTGFKNQAGSLLQAEEKWLSKGDQGHCPPSLGLPLSRNQSHMFPLAHKKVGSNVSPLDIRAGNQEGDTVGERTDSASISYVLCPNGE